MTVNKSVLDALHTQSVDIWHMYVNGNKNDARVRFGQVLHTRKAYVIMRIFSLADGMLMRQKFYAFLDSVTT